jgi:hypothetical protein
MPFTGEVSITQVDDQRWELDSPLTHASESGTFTVPKGFKTDLASVPRHFVWLFPTYGRYTKAAILHDYLVKKPPPADRPPNMNRSKADHIFRCAMLELGVPFVRRWMMWSAVRTQGLLRNTRPTEFASWLIVLVPSVAFLIVPFLLLTLWLILFKIVESIFWAVLKPISWFTKERVNRPSVLPQ